MTDSPRPHLLGLLAGLFLAAGLILSAMLVTRAWMRIAESQTIAVTGSARKNVRSDLIIWRGSFATEAATLLEAQRTLKADLAKVEAFLQTKGVTNFFFTPISIQELQATLKGADGSLQRKTAGYRLTQTVRIDSADVERIMQLDRDSTALVEQGVLFTPVAPEYIYTKAGDTKVEMLAEATKDARARAEQIGAQGSRRISQLRAAKMGVFQITPVHSLQTAWDGLNDTTALEKTITAVVTATFSLE
jgi:hypothetical protein